MTLGAPLRPLLLDQLPVRMLLPLISNQPKLAKSGNGRLYPRILQKCLNFIETRNCISRDIFAAQVAAIFNANVAHLK